MSRRKRATRVAVGLIVALTPIVQAPGSARAVTSQIITLASTTVEQFGLSVSGLGDVNGDGFSDVIVGAPWNSTTLMHGGRACIYFGGPVVDDAVDLILTGSTTYRYLGISVSGAGDVNGDGFADIIVGTAEGGIALGHAYVYFGGPLMDVTPDLTFTGNSDNLGVRVSGAGDVNGDGFADVIVGARMNDAGRAYAYFGGPEADAAADITFTAEADLGLSVSDAGDMNGDGYADVMVGSGVGRMYVYFGGPTPDGVADLVLTGVAGESFGEAASNAGDVNGDGYADVIVGAPLNSAGGSGAGRAYVYFGGPIPDAVADLTFTGEAAVDHFGLSVSSAGDVNRDGYDDLIVGARGEENAGRAYVYFGGLLADDVPDLTITGGAGFAYLGNSVSDAGDMTGDGFPDLIVGAPASGGTSSGRAFVYNITDPVSVTDRPVLNTRLAAWPQPYQRGGLLHVSSNATVTAGISSLPFLAIYDLSGRRVKTLVPDGLGSARWDGKNEAGESVEAGIYFLRQAGRVEQRTKIVLTP